MKKDQHRIGDRTNRRVDVEHGSRIGLISTKRDNESVGDGGVVDILLESSVT
jgi:hypothetical protein